MIIIHAEFRDGRIIIFDSFIHKETIKQIKGRAWNGESKTWSIPFTEDNLTTLKIVRCALDEALLEKEKEVISSSKGVEKTSVSIEPMPLKVKPYSHQIEGYNRGCSIMGILNGVTCICKGYALLMEMGCGKSITTVAITGRTYLNGYVNKLLVIAPKSIVNVWEEEFFKFADFPYSLTVLQGSSDKKKQQLQKVQEKGLQVAVINYESVPLIEEALIDWKPDFIVADESTRIKNPAAKTSKSIHKIAKGCKYRMILTGSPITQNPMDLYSQYKMLDEKIFGTSFYAFKNYYAVLGDYNQPVGYKNMPELIKKAHSIAYRVTKSEALELPKTIDKIQPVLLEDKAQKLYKQFVKDSYMEISKGEVSATNILTRLLRLQQITGGFLKADEETERYEQVSKAKLEALEDIIETTCEAGEKLVIMARFIPEIKEICNLVEKKKLKYSMICGEVKDRAGEIQRFQKDDECRIFVGQLQTTSMGITLTAASTCVFYSLSYNYADYIQAKARIHRIGQTKPCLYIHLVVKDTVDETVMEALSRKEDIAKSIIDDWKKIIK